MYGVEYNKQPGHPDDKIHSGKVQSVIFIWQLSQVDVKLIACSSNIQPNWRRWLYHYLKHEECDILT
jgi:hypothetical protein